MEEKGFIYAIEAEGREYIKIGFSTNVERRLAALQTGTPDELRLIAHWPGTLAEERQIHLKLKEWRIVREWFKASAEVLNIVERLSQGEKLEPPRLPVEELPELSVAEMRYWARVISDSARAYYAKEQAEEDGVSSDILGVNVQIY